MLLDFISGAVAMGFAFSGLFFLRFWRRTRDGLFLAFAIAFALLGAAQTAFTLGSVLVEERSWIFLLRLAAFSLILLSVWLKNRRT